MVRFVRSPRKKEKVTAHWRLLPVRPSVRPRPSLGTSHSSLLPLLSFGHACYLLSLVARPSVRPSVRVRPVMRRVSYHSAPLRSVRLPSSFVRSERSCPKTRPPPFIFGPTIQIDRSDGGRQRDGRRDGTADTPGRRGRGDVGGDANAPVPFCLLSVGGWVRTMGRASACLSHVTSPQLHSI